MLRLLPPVCHDCGKGAETAALSPYLDFLLCGPCVEKRERAIFAGLPAGAALGAEEGKVERAPGGAKASEGDAGVQTAKSGERRAPRKRKGSAAGSGKPKQRPGKKR